MKQEYYVFFFLISDLSPLELRITFGKFDTFSGRRKERKQ